jgi:YD repeat-containing protein
MLLISIFAALLTTAQPTATVPSPEEGTATMSDREQYGLRGPVKSCTEESTHAGVTDTDGKTYPEVHSEYTTEYDIDGHIVGSRSSGSSGAGWVTRYTYDASGRLLKTTSGKPGEKAVETILSYNDDGKLVKITKSDAPENPTVFHYDENGRKTKVQVSRAVDFRSDVAFAGPPFQTADNAPNLPGGGTATTIYDEHDRATEVQVRDATGELVSRALRMYDARGRVVEEKQILDNLETMIPAEARAKMLEQTGLSPDQLRQELRAQFTKLMGGQSGPHSVSYSYDTHGRVHRTSQRIFNEEQEIETIYNQHGDVASEITRSTRVPGEAGPSTPAPGMASYPEVSYSYKYDDHENWIEEAISYRSSPDGAFQSSTLIKRTLTYY